MPFFLKKQLFLDTNAVEFARIKAALDRSGIRYEAKTRVGENVLTRRFNAAAAAHLWQPYSSFSSQTYLYSIHVRAADYEKARAAAFTRQ